METSAYSYKFDCKPDFGLLTVQLNQGQSIKVEASAMATMDTNLQLKTKLKGGFSRFLSGETLFLNEFSANNGSGEISIAPAAPGDMDHVFLNNESIFLQNAAFVACGQDVQIDYKWQGFTKGFFSGESFFLVKCHGNGDVWFNSYGGIIPIDVEDGYVIDTGHIVAFTEGLDYRISKVGGYKSLFFSGEGLVCRFSGKGRVWIQTRKITPLLNWIYPFRPTKNN